MHFTSNNKSNEEICNIITPPNYNYVFYMSVIRQVTCLLMRLKIYHIEKNNLYRFTTIIKIHR
jgi:hypothetical protein